MSIIANIEYNIIFFDFDGTIVDNIGNIKQDYLNLWKKYLIQKYNFIEFLEICENIEINNYKWSNYVTNPLIRFKIKLSIKKTWDTFKKSQKNQIVLEEKVINYLLWLKKFEEIILVTNRTYLDIQNVNSSKIFSKIFLRIPKFGKKHQQDYLARVEKYLKEKNKSNNKLLMIGDSWDDIAFAKSIKADFIGVTSGLLNSEYFEKNQIKNYSNIDDLFKKEFNLII